MELADIPATGANGRPSVFFSYARSDRKRALPLIAALESAGFHVWWDGLLEAGTSFLTTTESALEGADAVVVLWSATSVNSHWVRDEATRGRDRNCLVPLSIDGSHAPLGFRQFQVTDLSKWRGKANAPEIEQLVRVIAGLAGQAARAPQPASSPRTSRRALLIGGGVAALAATGGLVKWSTGFFGAPVALANSIAVIPFKNLSGESSQAYFSDGLSEELRSTLSRNRMLRIAAPTSSSEFRDSASDVMTIAKKLGVAYVLRGSVRHDADELRILVELVDGQDAKLEWTQSLDRQLKDVFALQSEIATIVAKSLSAELTAKEIAAGRSGDWLQLGGTKNVAAFDAYLRGKSLAESSVNEDSDRAALALFDKAVALDAGYASALAARSKILAAVANETGRTAEIRTLYDKAIASARSAVKVAPDLAEAHSALGYALYNGRLDARAAQEPYDRSRELGAGDADVLRTFALYAAYTDRPVDASDAMERSLSLDPLNPGAFRAAGYIAYATRDYGRTIAMMRKALALNPKLSVANSAIGSALYLSGQVDEAIAAFDAEPLIFFKLQGLAIVKHRAGDAQAAKAALDEMIARFGSNSHYQQAQVLAQWGDVKAALARLAEAAQVRDAGLLLARTDPMLDPLRKAPEFAELLSRLGLS